MTDFAQKLQQETTGCRLATFALTCNRKMSKQQLAQVANLFSADQESVRGGRKALDKSHELLKPVFAILSQAYTFVKGVTWDYPERGLRLCKLSKIEWMTAEIGRYQEQLNEALQALDAGWDSVKADAKERLKDLYNEGDYPIIPSQSFGLQITFPAIKPDDRLLQLHPDLYAAEQARIAGMFQEAVHRAEAAAADELAGLLEHLVERLQPDAETGKAKKLHNTTVDKIGEFVERFKTLSIGSNAGLDKLIAEVEGLSQGLDPQAIRKSDQTAKQLLADRVKALREQVDTLVIVRPSRDMDLD